MKTNFVNFEDWSKCLIRKQRAEVDPMDLRPGDRWGKDVNDQILSILCIRGTLTPMPKISGQNVGNVSKSFDHFLLTIPSIFPLLYFYRISTGSFGRFRYNFSSVHTHAVHIIRVIFAGYKKRKVYFTEPFDANCVADKNESRCQKGLGTKK